MGVQVIPKYPLLYCKTVWGRSATFNHFNRGAIIIALQQNASYLRTCVESRRLGWGRRTAYRPALLLLAVLCAIRPLRDSLHITHITANM